MKDDRRTIQPETCGLLASFSTTARIGPAKHAILWLSPDVKRLELVTALLQSQSTLALATSGPDGSPRLAPLFYLPGENLHLYWFSSPSSEHARNLKRDPAAAVAIYRSTDQWKQICGVQMRGSVAVVTDRARRKSISKPYADRFQLGALFEAAMSRSRLYEFQPSWLRYIDNSRHFGYKFELSLISAVAAPSVHRRCR